MVKLNKKNFVDIFISNFVPNISKANLKKLHCYPPDGYLWGICEYDLVQNTKFEIAKNDFDNADKSEAIEFQYDNGFKGDEYSSPLSESNNTSNKIEKSGLVEFYVIGKDYSWCYITTHEPNYCGPYFIKNINKN